MRATAALACAGLVVLTCTAPVYAAPPRYAPAAADAAVAQPLDTYALDGVSRTTCSNSWTRATSSRCSRTDLCSLIVVPLYETSSADGQANLPVAGMVRDVAIAVYGRAPIKLTHMGGYVCRRMKTYPELLSEHALGNAIDIGAFTFARATAAEKAAAPAGLAKKFTLTVDKHWDATRGVGAVHAAFLRALADALIARADIFRVMLGPSYPGHGDHFHLDASNFRMIEF